MTEDLSNIFNANLKVKKRKNKKTILQKLKAHKIRLYSHNQNL